MRNARRLIPVIALALSGCGQWLGESEEAGLEGERVPVMLLERELSADPRIASLNIRLPEPVRNAEWAQTGGVPSHAMHHLEAADDLGLAWRQDIGSGIDDENPLLGIPVVADGKVFVVDTELSVQAFDASSGQELWEFEPENIEDDRLVGGDVAYDGGWLFLATMSGEIYGLNAETGAEIWRRDLRAPIRSAPTVADGRVMVLAADNQLFVLDGATGDLLWTHAGFAEITSLLGGPSPAFDSGVVIVPYSSGEAFALRLDNGRVLWGDTIQRPRRTMALAEINDIDGLPVIDRGRVFIAGHGGEMAAIDLRSGQRIWDIDLSSSRTPWVVGDYIYVLTTRNEVVALLQQGGRVRWVSPLRLREEEDDPDSDPVSWYGPVLVSDRLLLASSDGEAVTVSPYTGEILGRIGLPSGVSQAPIVADGTVYFLTDDADLLAYR